MVATPAKSQVNKRRLGILIGIPLAAVVLFGLAYKSRFGRKADTSNLSTANAVSNAVAVPATAELRLKSFQINHFARTAAGDAEIRGVLGESSFGVRVGDQVTLDVELSHPAFAYLVAFRPDGVLELIHPESADQPPPKTDHIRYPSAEHLDTRYEFEEGAGLCIFAIAASDQPLPAFQQWADERPEVWNRIPASGSVIFRHDGAWIDTLRKNGGTTRAKNKTALGAATPFWTALQYLKGNSRATFVAGQAIPVEDQP